MLVRGGGDLATGVAYRLKKIGMQVIVTELANPLVVRRNISFAGAVYEQRMELEGLVGQRVDSYEEAVQLAQETKMVPVVIDPEGDIIGHWKPTVVVDGIMAKRNVAGTSVNDALVVIGLGPGFTAGVDVHAVIETKRGHYLGRVLYEGTAQSNTGIPGLVQGIGRERVVYSSVAGIFHSSRKIGDIIEAGEVFGFLDDTPVHAQIGGCIRGVLQPGTFVQAGIKVGDVDPRKNIRFIHAISDKALAIGGGVLEGILTLLPDKITSEILV